MTNSELVERLRQELPRLLREESGLRAEIFSILEEHLVSQKDLSLILAELRSLREDFNKGFAEHSRILEEHTQAIRQLRQDFNRGFELHRVTLEEHARAVRELGLHITAIGARWGIQTEDSFREALHGILAERLGARIERWVNYDREGMVFGHPSSIEVDIAITDAEHQLLEIKSSISKGDVTILARKGEFYRQCTGIQAKLSVVSPFVEERAKELAAAFGIKVYTSI